MNVAIDSNENILTCGLDSANTRNTLRQVIPSISAASDLGTSLFVKKYDAVGNAVWIYGIGGWGANGAYSMALDKNNDIYVVGEFQGTIDFNPNGSNDFQHSHGATKDIFLTKLKSDGTYCYTTVLGGWQTERAQKTFIDPYQGDLYIAGFFSGGFNFDLTGGFDWRKSNGKKDAFVSRYSPNHAPNLQGPPVGRNVGTLETSYKFTATATDSDGDAIRYRFNWGDGKQTDWKSNNFASHRWLSPGTFCVKVQAIDDKDSVSDWSECANILIR